MAFFGVKTIKWAKSEAHMTWVLASETSPGSGMRSNVQVILTVQDFHLLVKLRVFDTEQMNQAVLAFRPYKDASLRYTDIESHERLSHY